VLRPGGRAVVGVGDPTAMASMPFARHGFRLRPVDDLVRGLQDAGLTVVRHGRVGDGDDAFHLLVAAPDGRD
jgi:arsenite methyltransferase